MTGLIRREDVAALLMADPGTLFTARGWNHALNAVLALPAAPAPVVPVEGLSNRRAYQVGYAAGQAAALRSAPPVGARVTVKPGEIERAVWSAMIWAASNNAGFNGVPEYTDRGNSFAEDEARRAAARILAALLPAGEDN